ncbi:unnamed protein product [Closterium sp. Naga37s-1]|nr:unnamed protein product [Closterium sp. Naga37s-1]
MVLWMSSGSQHTAAVAPCSVQQLDLWQPAECGTSSTEDHISDEEVVEMASLLLQCESLNGPRTNKDIIIESAEAPPLPSQTFTKSPHRGNKRQREESASTGRALLEDQNRRILIQPCNVKIEDLLGPESSSLESLQETIEFQMGVAAFNDETAVGSAAIAATAAPAVRAKSEGEVDIRDGEVDEGFNGYISTAAAESIEGHPTWSLLLTVTRAEAYSQPSFTPFEALSHPPPSAVSADPLSPSARSPPPPATPRAQARGDVSSAPEPSAGNSAAGALYATAAPAEHSALLGPAHATQQQAQLQGAAHPAQQVLLPLLLVAEATEGSANPHCDYCRSSGWCHHPIAAHKYHFIIPAKNPHSHPRAEHHHTSITAAACRSQSLASPTHLLHGVIHANGFGHLVMLIGRAAGSHVLSGRQLMQLVVSVEDLSHKLSFSSDYRLLHTLAFSHSWFARWGYSFAHGLPRSSSSGGECGGPISQALLLIRLSPPPYPRLLTLLVRPLGLLLPPLPALLFILCFPFFFPSPSLPIPPQLPLPSPFAPIPHLLGHHHRVVSVEDLSHKLSFSSDYRLLHTLAFSHSWFARWAYSFAHGAFGITQQRYSRAVARVAGTRLLPLLQHLRGINTGIASRVAAVVAKYQSHVLSAKCQPQGEYQPHVSHGAEEVDYPHPHASHALHAPHGPHGPHAAPPNLTLQHLFSSLLALRSSLPLPLHHQHYHFPHLLHPSALPLPFTPTTPAPPTAPSTPAAAAAPLAALPSFASSRSPLLSFSARRLLAPPPPLTLPPLFPPLQPMAARQLSGEPSPTSASCLSDELSPRQQQQRLLRQQQQQALPSPVPPISYQQMDVLPSASVATPSTITPGTVTPSAVTPRSKRTLLFLDSPISSALAGSAAGATPATPVTAAPAPAAAAAAAAGDYSRRLLCNEPIIISPLPADSPSCRWSSKRLHLAQQVIVDVLSLRPGAWLPRHEVREAARQRIGDTGLLDFVLKSLGNRLVGDVVVRRAINPLSKVLEFSLEPLQREGGERGGGEGGEGREGVIGEERRGEMEGQQGGQFFKDYKGELTREQAARAAAAAAGGEGVEGRDGVVTEAASEDEDGTIRVLCSIDARDADTNRNWPIPPPELITLPPEATVADLKVAACRAFAQTYPVARHMQVTALPTDLEDLDEDDVLFGSLDSGASLLLAISSLDAHSEWRYEGGNDTWAVRCVCGARDDDGERMIACDECGVWQHTRCAGIGDAAPAPMSFLCLGCRAGEKNHCREGKVDCGEKKGARRVVKSEQPRLPRFGKQVRQPAPVPAPTPSAA